MAIRNSTSWLLVGLLLTASIAQAQRPAAKAADQNTQQTYEQLVRKAIEYCRTRGQAADGSYSAEAGPAVTAIVTAGILKHGRTADDPLVAKSLEYIKKFVRPDGGIYADGSNHQNYETCVAIQCFAAANADGRFSKIIADAERYVKGIQWDESEGKEKSDFGYGGAGYGRNKRADLSNTSFLMDALKSVGRGPDDEAIARALIFVSRCQNLESQFNTTPFPVKNPDGGFYYTADAGGFSQAGTLPNGGLRSYGSMTYAGLKSMIYAGVDANDPRVKAATEWLRRNYTFSENPGMGPSGLYYYYQAMARALEAVGKKEFVDAAGTAHDWRAELIAELANRQQNDGSWLNENERWMESNPNLVTGYVLLTLDHCRPSEK